MARRRRPVALFEVIHRDKRFAPKPVPPLQRPVAAIPKPSTPPPAAASTVYSKPPTPRANPVPFRRMFRKAVVEHASAEWRRFRAAATPWVDRLKQRLEPQYPILAGAAAAFVIIGAVAITRHVMRPVDPASSATASLQQIRQQAHHPEVMEVALQTHPLAPLPDTPGPSSPGPSDALAQSADSVLPPAPRQVNLNYVLVQSYGDEKTANEACDFLNHNGIPCTIERGVKNWRKDFYLVIGLQGFTRVSGPDYIAYRTRIEALSAQFASPHSYYKGFAPQAIKWDRAN